MLVESSNLLPKGFDRSKLLERFKTKVKEIVDSRSANTATKLSKQCKTAIEAPSQIRKSSNPKLIEYTTYNGPDQQVYHGVRCISCLREITMFASHAVKMLVDMARLEKVRSVPIVAPNYELLSVEVDKSIVEYPTFETGRMCQICLDFHSIFKWFDSEGVEHPCVELTIDDRLTIPRASPRRERADKPYFEERVLSDETIVEYCDLDDESSHADHGTVAQLDRALAS